MSPILLPLEHLNDADLDFLAGAVSPRPDARDRIARLLRDGGDVIERALDDHRTHRALFQGGAAVQRLSPYLLFAVLLSHRRRLRTAQGSGTNLLACPWTRHYLAELLVDFSSMPPGTVHVSLAGRTFRCLVHEVDLPSLQKLALLAAEPDRLSIYRRLGDLTLFLSSVAPATSASGSGEGQRPAPPCTEEELEREGRRFYQLAAQHRGAAASYLSRTLAPLAAHYGEARGVLQQIVLHDVPRVYPGGFIALAQRQAEVQRFGDLALSAPEGGRE